jgi:hypothetical protein
MQQIIERTDKRDNQARIGTKYKTKELDTIHRIYFTEDHILGTEVAEILNIPTSYISNLKSDKILKVGNCPILLKSDNALLPKIRKTVLGTEVTSLKDKMCLSYFKSEYGIDDAQILNTIASEIETIAGKKFIKYTEDFLGKIKQPNNIDNLIYVCGKDEFKEFQEDDIIKHYYKINDKKYLIIY